MALHRSYQPARGCASGPTPGAKALMSWFLGAYGDKDPEAANLGIYVCKRLGSGWSLHAEGRACDLGTSPYSFPSWGQALADKLVDRSKELGVQLVIFNDQIWSGAYPNAGWRDYGGSNPHRGHLHVELSRYSAMNLTSRKIQDQIGGRTRPEPEPEPQPRTHEPGTRMLRNTRPMMRGKDVKYVQRWIGPRHAGPDDGIFGPQTELGVKWYQRIRGITVDGIVGPVTWRNMRVRWRG